MTRMGRYLVAAALSAAAPWQARAAPPPAPVPVEALADIPFFSDPVLSPDGKRLAATVNSGGHEALAVYEIGAPAETPPRLVPYAGALRWYDWAGNDRLLIGQTLLTLVIGPFPIQLTRLTRYDLTAGKALEIDQGGGLLRDTVIFTDPDGRYALLASQKNWGDPPAVMRIDLSTGAATEVQKRKSGIWSWFADSEGTIRGGIGYSGNGWTIYARDPKTGELGKAASGRVSDKESVVESIGLLPGSTSGIIVTNEKTGRFAVYEYDLRSNSIGAPIYENPEVDISSPILAKDGRGVEGVRYEDDRPRVAWLTPERRKLQAQIDRTLPGKVNQLVTQSRDGNVAIIWSGGADDPGGYYIFDRKARRMNLFATPYEKLVDARLSPVKPIRYTARDGLSIPGYLALPPGREPKGLPLIVMPHGGPFERDSYVFNPLVQLLASRGYAVLQPNFRGSTGYGRDFVERGYGQWGAAMQDDLDDGVAWLAKEGVADPRRVCIVGGSYGGYAALWGAIRNPEIYRCAVSIAGVTDIRALLKYDSKTLVAGRYSRQWRKKVEGEEKRDLAAVSPLQQAGRLTRPVLIAHGERDPRVPVEQSRKLAAALKARGAPVQTVFYKLGGHDFSRTEDLLDFMKRLEAFLEVHNPAQAGPIKGPRDAELIAGAIEPNELASLAGKKGSRRVEMRYLVTADGRVTSCSVTSPSGAADVDKQVCVIAEERFQYRPAVSAAGERQKSWQTRTATWELPAKK